MAFNAGGTNVGGIQVRPAGRLVVKKNAGVGITGVGSYTWEEVVPAGEIWNIKGFQSYSASFSGTLTGTAFRIEVGGEKISLVTGTSSTAIIGFVGEDQLFLVEGDKVIVSFSTSAYTSGDMGAVFLIQKIDI